MGRDEWDWEETILRDWSKKKKQRRDWSSTKCIRHQMKQSKDNHGNEHKRQASLN